MRWVWVWWPTLCLLNSSNAENFCSVLLRFVWNTCLFGITTFHYNYSLYFHLYYIFHLYYSFILSLYLFLESCVIMGRKWRQHGELSIDWRVGKLVCGSSVVRYLHSGCQCWRSLLSHLGYESFSIVTSILLTLPFLPLHSTLRLFMTGVNLEERFLNLSHLQNYDYWQPLRLHIPM